MRRRPPRSTRTDTLFPYTTRFRSRPGEDDLDAISRINQYASEEDIDDIADAQTFGLATTVGDPGWRLGDRKRRSVERRVGLECVSTCISRLSPYHYIYNFSFFFFFLSLFFFFFSFFFFFFLFFFFFSFFFFFFF